MRFFIREFFLVSLLLAVSSCGSLSRSDYTNVKPYDVTDESGAVVYRFTQPDLWSTVPASWTGGSDDSILTFTPLIIEHDSPFYSEDNPRIVSINQRRLCCGVWLWTKNVSPDSFGNFTGVEEFVRRYNAQEIDGKPQPINWYTGLKGETEKFRLTTQRMPDVTIANGKKAYVQREVVNATLLYGNKPMTMERCTAFILNPELHTIILVQMLRYSPRAVQNKTYYDDFIKTVKSVSF